jgi:hypothetical protein
VLPRKTRTKKGLKRKSFECRNTVSTYLLHVNRFFKTKVNYSGIDLPMKVPIGMYPDEVGDVRFIEFLLYFCAGK